MVLVLEFRYTSFISKQSSSTGTELDNINVPTTGSQFVPIPEFTALGYLVGVQINLAVKQQLSIREALKTAQHQSEAVMKRAGYYQN